MVGRVSSAIGLVIGGIVTILLGFLLTLMAYQDVGPVIIFYYGRYYGGIAGMVLGVMLILAGIMLPIFWPTERKKQPRTFGNVPPPLQGFSSESGGPKAESSAARSLELKIRGVSIHSTCGKEALQVLRLLSSQGDQIALSQVLTETGGDQNRTLKAIKLLVDLGFVKRHYSNNVESYSIAPSMQKIFCEQLTKSAHARHACTRLQSNLPSFFFPRLLQVTLQT